MDAELASAIAGAVVVIAGAVAGLLKVRANGKAKAESERTIIRTDDSTGAEDTGRFIIAMQQAPAETLEDVARSLRQIAGQKPASRDDLHSAEERIRSDMTRHNEAYSKALTGLRNDVDDLRTDLSVLPCQMDEPCPYIGGNGGTKP